MSRQAFRRVAVSPRAQPPAQSKTWPAPVRGWVTNTSLSSEFREGALVLDNWFPTATGIRLRGGSDLHSDVGSGDPILSMFTYIDALGVSTLFACDGADIWDVTLTVADSVQTGLTNGYVSTVQMKTAGGDYLTLVNGADELRVFDGTSWTLNAALGAPITGVDDEELSFVWVYRNREYFVRQGTMDAWYLGLDSIGGAATKVTLAGVFQRGGSLLFGGTWSIDSGEGADDKCVFVSTEGEVALYEGADPGAADWRLIGRYDITRPLGRYCAMRIGGDLLIGTTDGLMPLSQVFLKDATELSLAAVSKNIEPDWKAAVEARPLRVPWTIMKWPEKNLAIVSLPIESEENTAECFVVNVETKKWCRYTGWDIRSMAYHNGVLYFGTSDGLVVRAETKGSDQDEIYVCKYLGHFDHLKAIGFTKEPKKARAVFRGEKPFLPQLSIAKDWAMTFPAAPSSVEDSDIAEWDSAEWDEAVWDGAGELAVSTTRWKSVAALGIAHAPQVQVTCGTTPTPDAELLMFSMTYMQGALVV